MRSRRQLRGGEEARQFSRMLIDRGYHQKSLISKWQLMSRAFLEGGMASLANLLSLVTI